MLWTPASRLPTTVDYHSGERGLQSCLCGRASRKTLTFRQAPDHREASRRFVAAIQVCRAPARTLKSAGSAQHVPITFCSGPDIPEKAGRKCSAASFERVAG